MVVKIVPNLKDNPRGKLADAELHFTEGLLGGLKLIGFSVWERRSGGGRTVTFPARQYTVNGDRRSFMLLRPIDDASAQDRMRDLVLQAYAEYEAATANTVP
jgi:hypothetical protein